MRSQAVSGKNSDAYRTLPSDRYTTAADCRSRCYDTSADRVRKQQPLGSGAQTTPGAGANGSRAGRQLSEIDGTPLDRMRVPS